MYKDELLERAQQTYRDSITSLLAIRREITKARVVPDDQLYAHPALTKSEDRITSILTALAELVYVTRHYANGVPVDEQAPVYGGE